MKLIIVSIRNKQFDMKLKMTRNNIFRNRLRLFTVMAVLLPILWNGISEASDLLFSPSAKDEYTYPMDSDLLFSPSAKDEYTYPMDPDLLFSPSAKDEIGVFCFAEPDYAPGAGKTAAIYVISAINQRQIGITAVDVTNEKFSSFDHLITFSKDRDYNFIIIGSVNYLFNGGYMTCSRVEEQIWVIHVPTRKIIFADAYTEIGEPEKIFRGFFKTGYIPAPSTHHLMSVCAKKFLKFIPVKQIRRKQTNKVGFFRNAELKTGTQIPEKQTTVPPLNDPTFTSPDIKIPNFSEILKPDSGALNSPSPEPDQLTPTPQKISHKTTYEQLFSQKIDPYYSTIGFNK